MNLLVVIVTGALLFSTFTPSAPSLIAFAEDGLRYSPVCVPVKPLAFRSLIVIGPELDKIDTVLLSITKPRLFEFALPPVMVNVTAPSSFWILVLNN